MRQWVRGIRGLLLGMLLCAALPEARAGIDMGTLFGAGETPSPETILQRVVERGRQAEFTGVQETAIYKPSQRSSTQRVVQKGGRRHIVYLSPPELKGKEIYQDGALTLFSGGGAASPDIGFGDDLARLVKKGMGAERVAGRQAYVVEVRPTGQAVGSRRIWVDAQQWVPLRWEDRDARAQLLSRTTFTSIQFDRGVPDLEVRPPTAFAPSRQREVPLQLASVEDAERAAGIKVLAPSYLPKGYRRQAVTVTSFGPGHRSAQRVTLTYSNGLGLITLSQAPVQAIEDAPRPGQPQMVRSLGPLVWVSGDRYFVLLATPPLSRAEMNKIAGSVK